MKEKVNKTEGILLLQHTKEVITHQKMEQRHTIEFKWLL